MGVYIGVDVGKMNLDIHFSGKIMTIQNKSSSIEKFLKKIKQQDIELVVCEATGGYERRFVKTLQKENIPVFVEHANKIRSFAKSKGLLAKTDRIDAQLIAEYATVMKPKPKDFYLSETGEQIRELLRRRDQLLDDKTREVSRLDKCDSVNIKKYIASHIKFLDKQIKSIQAEINHLAGDPTIEENLNLLTSIPGIGQQTALMILSFLPEIGSLENKSLAALVGVAPFNRDSGQFRGKRFIQGGRKILRKALYMAAVASIRWNSPLREFYTRLRARGKPAKICVVAVINKMIAMINSVFKRRSVWVDNLPQRA